VFLDQRTNGDATLADMELEESTLLD